MSQNSLVVITGASHGIGRALALKFAKDGNPLLLISRSMAPLPELKSYTNVLYAKVNVVDYKMLEKSIQDAEKKYGETACLINNAGLLYMGEFSKLSIDKIYEEIDVLIKGVVNGIKVVLKNMEKSKSGTIINMSSIGDRKPSDLSIMYTASKHAIYSLSESLQVAQAKHNVRVINIAPGLVATNIHANMGISIEDYQDKFGNPIFLKSEEIADIVHFCWKQPQHICIRDIVVMPTSCSL